jgi:hypothetical protein
VPFTLDPSNPNAEILQGELLGNVWVHRTVAPASQIPDGQIPAIEQKHHAVTIVMQSDCDLLQDFTPRQIAREAQQDFDEESPNALRGILLCDAFLPAEIHGRVQGREFRLRVGRNQDERYHTLNFEPIDMGAGDIGELVLDFRKTFTVDTRNLYAAISEGLVRRFGVVKPVYVHDLMHRCYGYLSRVGLPE